MNVPIQLSFRKELLDQTISSSTAAAADVTVTESDLLRLDEALERAFLQGWKTSAKRPELPMLTSNFFRLHMVPQFPARLIHPMERQNLLDADITAFGDGGEFDPQRLAGHSMEIQTKKDIHGQQMMRMHHPNVANPQGDGKIVRKFPQIRS